MKSKINASHIALNLLIAFLTLNLCGCSATGNTSAYTKSGLYFDTAVSVQIYTSDSDEAETILDECMNICDHYQSLFDSKIITSDISNINSSDCTPVNVDPDTVSLLSDAMKYCSLTNGLFDITVKPVSDLWDFHEGSEHIPSDDEIRSALRFVDWKNVSVDPANNTVTILKPGTSIDIGAVAKGFIADKITSYLHSQSITGAIVNMGGDMRLIGSKPDGSSFNIGINDPFDKGAVSLALSLSDISVATSGTYERCFEKNGIKYHHILDTETGKPCKTDLESVTVITENAIDSDCLCTVCILMGSSEATELIENIPGTEAVFILDDGSVVTASGADDFIRY